MARRLVGLALVLVIVYWGLRYAGRYAGAARHNHVPLSAGSIRVPEARTMWWSNRSALTDSVLAEWAGRELLDWEKQGKMRVPRILLKQRSLTTTRPMVEVHIWRTMHRSPAGGYVCLRLHPHPVH